MEWEARLRENDWAWKERLMEAQQSWGESISAVHTIRVPHPVVG